MINHTITVITSILKKIIMFVIVVVFLYKIQNVFQYWKNSKWDIEWAYISSEIPQKNKNIFKWIYLP